MSNRILPGFGALPLTRRSLFRLALAPAAARALGPARALASVPRDLFVMALRMDDITGLDPAELFEFTGAEVVANIYDRLLYYNLDDVRRITGGVAESWTVSEDGLTYRFRIRTGMSFQSGNSVTAEDAAYSLRRVILLNKAPAFILAQFGLTPNNVPTKVRTDGPDILVVETDRAYAPSFFLACLTAACASIVDAKLVESHAQGGDFGNRWLRTHSAGSGPFSLREWRPSELLILDRFGGHWRGAPAMKTVFIRHIAEPGVQRLLIERGDIDVARNLGPDQAVAIKDKPALRVRYARKGSLYYLGLNQKIPNLRIPAVRKALKYLVDYEAVATTILRGTAEVHETIIPSGYLGALDEKPYEWNPEAAKHLLAEAGLRQGFAATLDVWNTRPDLDIAQSLQASFAEAGVSLRILQGDGKQVLTKYRARNHEIFLGRWGPDFQDPHSNAQAFASNPDNSDSGQVKTLAWRNAWDIPELTELTDQAILVRDPARRAALYGGIQRQELDDSPFVVLFQEVDLAVVRADVRGFVMGPSFDTVYYRGVTKEAAS